MTTPGPRATGEPSNHPSTLRQFEHDLRTLITSLRGESLELREVLREQLERRPLPVLAAAFGAGYVLGGGLTLRVTSILLANALRLTAGDLVGTMATRVRRVEEEAHG